jgi:threonylcarbamoyladenosine tRNA methylthiotransferase MtaB
MTTIAITTLGCKVNQFESEALMASIEEKGYTLVPFGEKADITIINTCTVTHRADFQARQLIRRAYRSHPDSLIVVTGCYAQVEAEKVAGIEGVSYVLGNVEKDRLGELLPRLQEGEAPRIRVADIQEERSFCDNPLYSFHYHTRAFLKIQDGCDSRCSYCIVPRARGPSRSLQPEKVLKHLRALKERGFKEVVLTGIHISTYGRDLDPPFPLERLIEEAENEGTPDRIRLSSLEPVDFSPGLISLLSESGKVCPHLHIPVQSGDDEILQRMNRNYSRSFLSDLIQGLHQRIRDVSIGADIIVGFPEETEERFGNTVELIESLPISYLHVFPFSKRRGTPAAQFSQQVDEGEIRARAQVMRELGQKKKQAFYHRFLNREVSALIEDRRDRETGRWRGLSRNYIPVLLMDDVRTEDIPRWVNQEWPVAVTGVRESAVEGRIAEERREPGDIVLTPLESLPSSGEAPESAGMNEERLTSLKELEGRLGYEFKDPGWLDKALTHKSFAYQVYPQQGELSAKVSNEVLEFLGDAVLGLAVSHLLLQRFPDAQEGELSKKRSNLVKQSSLAFFSSELELERCLLLGKGELQSGGKKKSSIRANVYEAVIGAIYMDSGFDRAMEIVRQHLGAYLLSEGAPPLAIDYKSLLQELIQRSLSASPQYRVLKESGPDHDKRFQASVVVGGEVKGMGWGRNKKAAEQEAARSALDELEEAPMTRAKPEASNPE